MNTNKTSMPFPPDTATPKTRDEIITSGTIKLRHAHKQQVDSHRAAFEARAESEWLRAEQRRKEAFITKYREDNYVKPRYPYADYFPAAQYRVSLEPDRRIEGLAAVELWSEVLHCFMSRSGTNKAPIDLVKSWFRPYCEVDGNYSILSDRDFPQNRAYATDQPSHSNVIVHAQKLSKQLSDILTDTWMIEARYGHVVWKERDIDATEF